MEYTKRVKLLKIGRKFLDQAEKGGENGIACPLVNVYGMCLRADIYCFVDLKCKIKSVVKCNVCGVIVAVQ